tara:strand:+ start:3016 stop:3516 length:501 start_codon:yes stop_codon:yes gene_type:complete
MSNNSMNLNVVGHEAINILNEFSHQILNNVCEFIEPVVHQINPNIQVTQNRAILRKNVYHDKNENDTHIFLFVHIPGVKKEYCNISLENALLTLTARTDFPTNIPSISDEEDWSFVSNFTYYKQFSVPENTKPQDIQVRYNSMGTLQIVVKKKQTYNKDSISIEIK